MNTIRWYLGAFVLLISFSAHAHEDDSMTRMERVPQQGVMARVMQYAREHAVCMVALTAVIGYMYVHSLWESMKPNPYEGPLAQAHEQIAELEAALMKFESVYRVLSPVLRYKYGLSE